MYMELVYCKNTSWSCNTTCSTCNCICVHLNHDEESCHDDHCALQSKVAVTCICQGGSCTVHVNDNKQVWKMW